jgi:hypothetical protein
LSGAGRLVGIADLAYALVQGALVLSEGAGEAVAPTELDTTERVLLALTDVWQTRAQVAARLAPFELHRSRLLAILHYLVAEGLAERDPAEVRQGARYRFRRALDEGDAAYDVDLPDLDGDTR